MENGAILLRYAMLPGSDRNGNLPEVPDEELLLWRSYSGSR